MTKAQQPFIFMAASPLIRICGDRAHTLGELLEGLRRVSDSSIFTHTFHTVEKHHFLTEGFSNDFAHWVLAALNEHSLAEQLEALDIRQYPTLGQLGRTSSARSKNTWKKTRPTRTVRPSSRFTFANPIFWPFLRNLWPMTWILSWGVCSV